MVICINCRECVPLNLGANGRRFLACDLKYSKFLKKNKSECWMLQFNASQALDKAIQVKPLENHSCADFKKRTEDQFDIATWWLKSKVLRNNTTS